MSQRVNIGIRAHLSYLYISHSDSDFTLYRENTDGYNKYRYLGHSEIPKIHMSYLAL